MKKYTVYLGNKSDGTLLRVGESDNIHGCRVIAGKNRAWQKGQNIRKIVETKTFQTVEKVII